MQGKENGNKEGTSMVEERQKLYNFSLEFFKMTSLSALKFKEPRKEGTADKLQSLAGVKPAVSPPVLCFHRSGQQLAAQIEDCIWCAKIRFLERCLALALCCPVKAMITCCF